MNETAPQNDQKLKIATWIPSAAGLTLFVAALLYFLGRLYLTAYYGYFGLGSGVLSFSTYDYMFSSVPIILMITGAIPGVLLSYISFMNWWPFNIRTGLHGKERRSAIATEIGFWVLFALVIYNFFTGHIAVKTPYLNINAFAVGVAIGAFFPLVVWIVHVTTIGVKDPQDTRRRIAVMWTSLLIVYFFATTPVFANKMADRVATSDLSQLPHVTIVSKQSIPEAKYIQTNHLDARLLIVNDNWVYFFSPTSDNQSSQNDTRGNMGALYSIKTSDIERIVYQPSSK